jgi:hypothetical protein
MSNDELFGKLELDHIATQKATCVLDESDRNRLDCAIGETKGKPSPQSLASGTLIDWFATNVARFDHLMHANDTLVAPVCIHVPSHVLDHALTEWKKAFSPLENYTVASTNGWCKDNNLQTLQEMCGGGDLLSLPSWKRISFVLNSNGHWSVMMLIRGEFLALVHYDTMVPGHWALADQVRNMLCAAGLIQSTVRIVTPSATVQQADAWSCGYAVMARLYEHGVCTFFPDHSSKCIPISADELLQPQNLAKFLCFVKQRNETAIAAEKLLTRYRRIYL